MNEKQKRFAEYYAQNPNATAAAIAAGYSERTARSQGQRLLTNADIKNYIADLQEIAFSSRIASISEVKAFWSDTMRNKEEKQSDRIRASHLLAKSAGVFFPKTIDSDINNVSGIDEFNDVMIYDDPSEIYEDENQTLIWMPRKKTEECSIADNQGEIQGADNDKSS